MRKKGVLCRGAADSNTEFRYHMNASDGEEDYERITYGENIELAFDDSSSPHKSDHLKEVSENSTFEIKSDADTDRTNCRQLRSRTFTTPQIGHLESDWETKSRKANRAANPSEAAGEICPPILEETAIPRKIDSTPVHKSVPSEGITGNPEIKSAALSSEISQKHAHQGKKVSFKTLDLNLQPMLGRDTVIPPCKRLHDQENKQSSKRPNHRWNGLDHGCSINAAKDERLPMLNQHNMSIGLLPGLLESLISKQSVLSVIETMVSATDLAFLVASTPSHSHYLLHEAYIPVADLDKGYMLAMMYGEVYAQALKIYRTHTIEAEPLDSSGKIVSSNLHAMLCEGCVKKVTIVPMPSHEIDIRGVNRYLEEIKYEISDELEIRTVTRPRTPRTTGRTDTITVDIRNWYCECGVYQAQFAEAKHEWKGSEEESLINSILQTCPSRVLVPLPMCAHILAILIKGSHEK